MAHRLVTPSNSRVSHHKGSSASKVLYPNGDQGWGTFHIQQKQRILGSGVKIQPLFAEEWGVGYRRLGSRMTRNFKAMPGEASALNLRRCDESGTRHILEYSY